MHDTSCFYNEELKDRFINDKSEEIISVTSMYYMFKKVAKIETELNKDLCDWNYYEIIEYYKLLNCSSIQPLIIINAIFSQYTQFCLMNNIVKDSQNHYAEVKREVLIKCINKLILNKKCVDREQVLTWIDELPNPKDQFIMLGVFEFGKRKNYYDIANAKPEDVDLRNCTLKLENRTVKISEKLAEIIKDCMSTNYYFSVSGSFLKRMPLIYDGHIVKKYPNEEIKSTDYAKGRNIYQSLTRSFKYLGVEKWMNGVALVNSGKIYSINQKAKELNISGRDVINSDHIKEINNQYDSNIEINARTFILQYEDYLA